MTGETLSERERFETPLNLVELEDIGKVILALNDERYDFRTLNGINEQTGIETDIIEHVLEPANGVARISPMTSELDEALYRPAGSPLTMKERVEMVRLNTGW